MVKTPPGPDQRRKRTGLRALKGRLKLRGTDVLDRRSKATRTLLRWRGQLVADQGGEAALTAAQLAIIDGVAQTKAIRDHVAAFLLEQKSLVRKTKRGAVLLPIVSEFRALSDSLARQLAVLGIDRKPKPVKALDAYVAEKYGTGKRPGVGNGT